MKYGALIVLLLIGLLSACTPGAPGGSNTGTIKAVEGGVVEVGGAKLTIPPGALNRDANVRLEVKAKPSEPKENPLQPAGPAVNLDLGGANLNRGATLELPLSDTATVGSPVVLEARPSTADGEPLLWVHAAKPVSSGATSARVSAQGLPSKVSYNVTRAGLYTAYVIPQPKPTELTGGTSLEVPFYYQAGLPWCVPTSLAMALNYYKPLPAISANPKFPGGFASNYGLASLIKQSANSGASAYDILKAAGVPESSYRFMRWDAELIPSDDTPSDGSFNTFVAYVALATTGVLGLATPQPVWTSSDRLWHAFVITGLTGAKVDGVYINDSNARPSMDWNGTHASQSWKAFREANCTLKDDKDPSKGCKDKADAGDPDLYTLIFYSDVKPETERRGSIELSHGGTVYFGGNPYVFSASLRFLNPSGQEISRWQWEGAYPNGYYYSDEATKLGTFPYSSNLVQDNEFRYLIYRSSQMQASFNVNNLTNVALNYDVEARLYVGGSSKAQKFTTVNVKAYNASTVNLDFGNLADVAGPIGGPTPARLELNLRQNGALQDVKTIAFKLAPDPTELPQVRILVPSVPTTLLKGEPFTFKGEGFDAHTLPDGRAKLSWFEGGSKLGDGGQYAYTPASAGSHTLSLVATGEYGTQATAAATVNVIDPTRIPGEIVIVEPKNGAAYWSPNTNQALVDVPLVGYATYSNGAAVPGERLVWTANDVEVGRGSSLTVQLVGGRNYAATYTLKLTVLSEGGTPIGSQSVTITVGYTYIG